MGYSNGKVEFIKTRDFSLQGYYAIYSIFIINSILYIAHVKLSSLFVRYQTIERSANMSEPEHGEDIRICARASKGKIVATECIIRRMARAR